MAEKCINKPRRLREEQYISMLQSSQIKKGNVQSVHGDELPEVVGTSSAVGTGLALAGPVFGLGAGRAAAGGQWRPPGPRQRAVLASRR